MREALEALNAATALLVALADDIQGRLGDLEEKQSERETDARQEKIDELIDRLECLTETQEKMQELALDMEGWR